MRKTAGFPKEPRVLALSHCPARGGNLYAFVRERRRGLAALSDERSFSSLLLPPTCCAQQRARWQVLDSPFASVNRNGNDESRFAFRFGYLR